ncbi:MAG: hypothetical protein AAGF85_11510 [Bacteroidota bacterium]
MFRKRKLIRVIAIFLTLELMLDIAMPYMSYALTSGPTAPEFTNFEPVDTTDMVNLATGDFTYNLPVLDVPGSAGGYPISLAYHSGTQMDEEASWVGLGFSLNAGAINRIVNGVADDSHNTKSEVIDDWVGGSTTTYSAGVGLPGVMAGVTYSKDTYRGVGMGTSLSFGFSLIQAGNFSAGLSATAYRGGYGQSTLTTSAGLSVAELGGAESALGSSLSVNRSFDLNTGETSNSVGIGISSASFSLLGASIASGGGSANLSGGGFQMAQVNKGANDITTETSGFNVTLPGPGFLLNFGKQKTRYFIYSREDVNNYGSLYPNHSFDPTNTTFDSYPIFDGQHGIAEDPEKYSIGSLPAYDSYNVLGQGIGGSIQPYILDYGVLYRENDQDIIYSELGSYNRGATNFRFKHDVSNYHLSTLPTANFSGNTFVGFNNDQVTEKPSDGWSQNENQLAGSKHIDWFTNEEVKNGHASNQGLILGSTSEHILTFIDGTDSYDVSKQIGGYRIITADGINYHYTQPVYAYGECAKSETVDDSGGNRSHERITKHPYAYTWLLTSVTGPDFVDKNGDGIANLGDWGYWVSFDYGKWAPEFHWRNPYSGLNIDLQQNIESSSWGKKELFYLNAIQTDSHTAIFVKDIRNDGKGVQPDGSIPTSSLRLNNIYLFDNDQLEYNLDQIKTASNGYQHNDTSGKLIHDGETVIDDLDLTALDLSGYKKRVKFNYDFGYGLCNNTPNSYAFDYSSPTDISSLPKTGKLTLKSLTTYGHLKKGTAENEKRNLIPELVFNYTDNNPDYDRNAHDMWGYYKSDRNADIVDENVDRMTTKVSKEYVDAWSLNEIITPLGSKIKIKYESDTYLRPLLMRGGFKIEDIVIEDEASGRIRLMLEPRYLDALESFKDANGNYIGGQVSFNMLLAHPKFWWKTYWKSDFLIDGECRPYITNRSSDYETFYSGNIDPVTLSNEGIILNSVSAVEKLKEKKQTTTESDCPFSSSYKYGAPCWEGEAGPCYGVQDETIAGANIQEAIFMGGFISMKESNEVPGGGLRVKELSVFDSFSSLEKKTVYTYTQSGKSSGITSYEPNNLGYHEFKKPTEYNAGFFDNLLEGIKKYRNTLVEERKILQQSRNIPGPGVYYQRVLIEDYVNGVRSPNHVIRDFDVFRLDESVRFKDLANNDPRVTKSTIDPNLLSSVVRIIDVSNNIGFPTNTKVYHRNGAGQSSLISSNSNSFVYDYKPDPASDARLGEIQQTFYEYKEITGERAYYDIQGDKNTLLDPKLLHRVQKVEIPRYLKSTETFVSQTNLSSTMSNEGFDLYTGVPNRTLTTDSYGNAYITEIEPAYRKYDGVGGMGLVIHGGANMLTQEAASRVYKIDNPTNQNPMALISASVQTWSDEVAALDATATEQLGIWRKHRSYSYLGNDVDLASESDNLYPYGSFQPFDAWNHGEVPTSNQWQKNSEITLYNINSHALEAMDVNGNYAATKMDKKQEHVYATAANASYKEFAYSGLEDYDGGGSLGGGLYTESAVDITASHSGSKSLFIEACTHCDDGDKGFNYISDDLSPGRTYIISFWASRNSAKTEVLINGSFITLRELAPRESNHWYLYRYEFTVPESGGTVEIKAANGGYSQSYVADDFRFHPIDATMASYVYNEWDELEYLLDANNIYTKYEYDAMGRLQKTYRETFDYDVVKTSETLYNYKYQD